MTKLIGISAALLLALSVSGEANAAQGVKRIGVQAGFAGLSNEGSFAGFGGGLTAGYAITDAWTLGVSATASSNHVTENGPRGQVFVQSVGVSYALDILQIVPYFGIYAGLYELHGGTLPKTEVKGGGQVALGVDWVYSRDFTFGLELRGHAIPGDFLRSPDNPTPFYATTFVKAEYTWGWF